MSPERIIEVSKLTLLRRLIGSCCLVLSPLFPILSNPQEDKGPLLSFGFIQTYPAFIAQAKPTLSETSSLHTVAIFPIALTVRDNHLGI